MKKIFGLTLAGALLLNGWVVAQPVQTALQAVIDSMYAADPGAVGIMVHVESPDRGISWSGASGFSGKGAQDKLDPDQPGLIASSIKTYVSATILKLVENKKLSIHQPIGGLLTDKTRRLFEQDGYDLEAITIKHLLSHTSGIANYANQDYVDFINANKSYRWTRDEQLELTVKSGDPLGNPDAVFNYTDANYLLLTEIIEGQTHVPFYSAMRELLRYDELGLDNTWFPTLEGMPAGTKPLVHQYWDTYGWDSYALDVSFDLYGGGGIACTTHDLASFSYNLFNAKIIEDTAVLNLIFTEIKTDEPHAGHYYLGLRSKEFRGFTGYGHSGFWGTDVLYFPDLDASVSIFVLERSRGELRETVLDRTVGILMESN